MKHTPSKQALLTRSFWLALNNIWRNKVLSFATVLVIGTIIFIFNIILTVNFIAQNAIEDLNKKIDLTVYLKESATEENIQKIIVDLDKLPEVEEIKYISKEDALNELKTSHPDISIAFEKYQLGNPLPPSLNITTSHPAYQQVVYNFLNQKEYQPYLSNIGSDDLENKTVISSVTKNLISMTNFTYQVIFWLIIIFILGGALIILNALQITIFTRKKEISIMKLVGASHWFIRSPFVIESIIYSFAAILLSFIMMVALAGNIEIEGTSLWKYYSEINLIYFFLIELGATLLLGISSSLIVIHEHLQKDLA